MQSFGLTSTLLCVLIAVDARDDPAKKDLEKFQGNWQLISLERDGKKTPQEEAKKFTLSGFCGNAWPRDRRHLASGANSRNTYAVGVAAQSPESRQRTPGQRRAPSSFLRRRRCSACAIAEGATPPRRVWGCVVILRCNTFGVGCNGARRYSRSALPRLRALRCNAFGVCAVQRCWFSVGANPTRQLGHSSR